VSGPPPDRRFLEDGTDKIKISPRDGDAEGSTEDSNTDPNPSAGGKPFVFGGAFSSDADSGDTLVGTPAPVESMSAAKTEIIKIDDGNDAPVFPVLKVETILGSSDVEIVRESFSLGRAPDNDVVIPDELVSRKHAVIERRDHTWVLVDQQTSNGTFVNGNPIDEIELRHGDTIQMGDATLTYLFPVREDGPPVETNKTTILAGLTNTQPRTGGLAALSPKNRRLFLVASSIIALLGILGIIKKFSGPSREEQEAQLAAQVAREQRQKKEAEASAFFDKVRELARQERWTQARPLIDQVAQVFPDDPRVKEYQNTIQREAFISDMLLDVKNKITAGDLDGALLVLSRVPEDSSQKPITDEIKKECTEKLLQKKTDLARQAFDAKNYPEVVLLSTQLLQMDPSRETIAELKSKAEQAIFNGQAPQKSPAVGAHLPSTPKAMLLQGSSLAAYRTGNITQAIEEAGDSGVRPEGIESLRKIQHALQQGRELTSDISQSTQAEKSLNDAMKLDARLSGGTGKISEEVRSLLAKVYFMEGVDAHTRKDYPVAYKNYTKALHAKPDMKAAADRLKELEKIARGLFEAAYVFQNTHSEKAISNCKMVLQMVSADNPYHGQCKKLLDRLEGTEEKQEGPLESNAND
jgi:tetratricopeptide (TPR) repeat protein